MSLFSKLMGGSADKKPVSAREALPLAEAALKAWSEVQAASAELCCVYSGTMDSEREILRDGRSRAWHFDFHLPASQSFYLVRVVDGKSKGRERTRSEHPVEYVCAWYGSDKRDGSFPEPIPLPDGWADTTAIAEAAFAGLRHELGKDVDVERYGVLCLFADARYLRYAHPEAEPKLVHVPPPASPCFTAILSHEDVDREPAVLTHIDAVTADLVATQRIEFPPLFFFGISADW
ncbi:MAG TPA: hypothetical protein PLO37_01830 [Candidatus Hydrogenedentes bacterium]|nr:hypothetical protein [Candidatus Hydrogenedentota bacterium]HPG65556.1 hypothetical protein [Candidatus Hydrogenedentota bacterium]